MEVYKHFASLPDMIDWLDATPSVSEYNQSRKLRENDWGGTETWEEAQRLVREGWPEGRAALAKAITSLPPITQARGRLAALGFDVAGAYPIVPMAVAGEPACMVTVGEQERATRPYVRFHLSCSASGGIDASVIQARGAAILAWVDALEDAGARCEIMLHFKAVGGSHACGFTCMLKKADEPLDIDRMAYALVNPAMLRRHAFAFLERTHTTITTALKSKYGTPASMPPEGDNVVCFDHAMFGDAEWSHPAKASAHVKQAILKACGNLNGMLDTDQAA